MSTSDERQKVKREAILTAAAELIVDNGYEATSLDAVVERAACSKSAIYELFGNKEGLLNALTEDVALELRLALQSFHHENLSVEETLSRYGHLALERILSERHTAIVRATIAAAWRYPAIGKNYYTIGALAARSALADYFSQHSGTDLVDIEDVDNAAREFQSLLFYERVLAQIVGAQTPPDNDEIDTLVNSAVSSFLAIYANDRDHERRAATATHAPVEN